MSKLNYFSHSGVYSICVLVLLIEGLDGFFIKHSGSGLCLKPTIKPFNKGSWGSQFYAQFYDQCLHPDAQFRFTDEHYLHNIAKNGTFFARSETKYLQRFLVYNAFTERFVRNVNFRLNQKKSGSLSVYNGSYCAIPEYLEKPYKRYNLIRTTTCDQDLQKFTFGSVTNYSETMNDVNCASSQVIDVMKAEFGVFSNGLSFVYDSDTMCSSFALCVVKAYCDRKISCNMSAGDNLFKLSQCPKTSRQLYVEHNCVDTPGVTITTVSKIRLSDLPYRGSIEVTNGTTWIKANDETWNKEKEVALCHHLGYINTKSSSAVDHVTIGAGQRLASGDLYCYGTQTNDTSCCAQLVPSTSTKESKIPLVHCEICKEPLLQDISKFPNSVFSASDSDGYKSRVSNNGWCPTNVGPKYLQIDLQREYYISHIATFGDKAQTKWLESYSLQYSRTLGDLGSSWVKMITANRDAYRASIFSLDYAYARYIKIIPKLPREAFCIRVQLCGAPVRPVQTVVIRNVTAASVHVSWSLPQNEGHSDATYFLVSLNGNSKKHNVSRSGDRNQYTLNDLKPYTNYEVTIRAGSANGVSESVSKLFKTTVKLPDRVQNVLYSSAPAVGVSWSLPQNEQQSHVTYFLVSLSGNGLKHNVSRKNNSNQYTFIDLKPRNTYTVTIEAGNPYGVGEIVSGTFTTNEAAALQSETSEDRLSKTALYVIISVLSVIIAVLVVVLMCLYIRRSKSQPPACANNNPLSERVYENVQNPPSCSVENLGGDTSDNVYQNVDHPLMKPDDDDTYESMDPIEIKKGCL